MSLITKSLGIGPLLCSRYSLTLRSNHVTIQSHRKVLESNFTNNHIIRHASYFKAARVSQFSQPLIVEDVKQRSLKQDEVRIGIYCCGINSIDVSNCSGELEPKPALPFIPGYEVNLSFE